ncbi:MAG TPA: aldo/keto reductase [Actinomycetota bacterium]|nr:aldo/keto reductase [Actinomycetota bacterium]
MRRRRLGSDGPEISVIGFGAWEAGGGVWGPNPPDDRVIEAIHAGLDAGIDWIDTAEVYGSGESERIVGLAIAGRRDDVRIATKVGPSPEGTGHRPDQVAAACDVSLGRLGIERIDLYQLHWPDETGVPLEDTWGAMVALLDAGKVGAIGVSNFDRAMIETCEAIRHVDSLQQELSMLHLEDRDLIRWCGEHGTGVVSYSPLAVGMLTGRFDRAGAEAVEDWRREDEDSPFTDANLARSLAVVEGLRPITGRLGCTVAQLALAWNVQQPGVTAAIAGSRSAANTRDNATAGDIVLDDATLAELDALL